MSRKTNFKFEGVDPKTGKPFKVVLSGWVPESLILEIQKHINRILLGEDYEPTSNDFDIPILDTDSLTIKRKVEIIVLRHFRHGWFTSHDVQEHYMQVFREKLKPSTVSMCLQRLYKHDDILERRGSRAQRSYRLKVEKVKHKIAELAHLNI